MTTTENEFSRLAAVYGKLGHTIHKQPPASEAEIESIQEVTEVEIDESLKELWRISNGSSLAFWFVDGDDDEELIPYVDEPTPYLFLSVERVLEDWRMFAPYDAALYEKWYDDESWGERDPRIQRHFLRHSKWISFAEFNGGSYALHFDADPTPMGVRGQIIYYVHDPDGVFWVANSFLEFFERSNDLLEDGLEDDPEWVAEILGLS